METLSNVGAGFEAGATSAPPVGAGFAALRDAAERDGATKALLAASVAAVKGHEDALEPDG